MIKLKENLFYILKILEKLKFAQFHCKFRMSDWTLDQIMRGSLDQHISELHLSLIIRQSLWRLPSHDNNTSNYKSQILYDSKISAQQIKLCLVEKKLFLIKWILSTCTASIIYIIVMVTGTCTYTQDSAL